MKFTTPLRPDPYSPTSLLREQPASTLTCSIAPGPTLGTSASCRGPSHVSTGTPSSRNELEPIVYGWMRLLLKPAASTTFVTLPVESKRSTIFTSPAPGRVRRSTARTLPPPAAGEAAATKRRDATNARMGFVFSGRLPLSRRIDLSPFQAASRRSSSVSQYVSLGSRSSPGGAGNDRIPAGDIEAPAVPLTNADS